MRTRSAAVLLASTLLSAALTAACSSGGSSGGAPGGGEASRASAQHLTAPPRPALLIVDVTLSGGPMGRDGNMALSDSPDVGDTVTVTSRAGRTWMAPVDRDGNARFTLPAGQYEITSATCVDVHRIELAPNGLARVGLHCDVP
jgi:hypothetical protein